MVNPLGAARLYSQNLLNGDLDAREGNPVSVAGVVTVLSPDPERVSWVIVNLSGNDMYLGFSKQVSATNGLLLGANGGYISAHVVEDFELTTRGVYVYSVGAANQMYRVSQRRQTGLRGG